MSSHTHIRAICILLTALSSTATYGEPTRLTNDTPLKSRPNQALDADGNPLPIPQEFAPAMEYRAVDAKVKAVNIKAPKRRHSSSSKAVASIADDASCRWLNSRMNELKKRLDAGSRLVDYINDEMRQYRRQWRCLQCDGNGPAAGDHARCGM